MDIDAWLRGLGLGQYEATFRENRIDADILAELTEADLAQLGLPLGDRKRLLKAIAGLGASEGAAPHRPTPASDAGERRQLTVMFCDLVGSTPMSTRLDPEDMREIIGAYQSKCSEIVARYDGFVAKFMGDGLLAYFGFPRAHEDDAERAVRAALDIADAIPRIETRVGAPLNVRIGIATGVVVVGNLVGQGSAQEQAVVGETPNLAARLQALAAPGKVLIGETTRRLLGGTFELAPIGPQALKGFDAPIHAWAALREAENVSRFEAARSHAMSHFVGREHEIALLMDRWREASEGEGQVVLVSGEAGIGKSRILAALCEQIGDEPHIRMRYQCSPHHVNDAFYPISSQLWQAAGFSSGEPVTARLDKLEACIERSGLPPKDVAPLLAALFSTPLEGRYPKLEMAPVEQKERTIAALIAMFEALTRQAPVLALLEDLHWIDPTSLDVFSRLVDRAPKLRVLFVITYRPEFGAPWLGQAHVASLSLSRFARRQTLAIVDGVTGGKPMPREVLEQIVEKTDGVPLFVEELTKTVLESGLLREENGAYVLTSAMSPLAIPSTLQDSLMARLDRLAPVKEIAQIGAVIGREFTYGLLEAVAPIDGPPLEEALEQLTAAELIHARGQPPEATYVFKHALVQDAAYASLLKSRRHHWHQRIAEAIRDRLPETAEQQPGLIANHFTQAGLLEPAVEWWDCAGRCAMSRFANVEAVESYSKGLALLADLPKSEARARRMLSFRLAVGPALLAARGYASREVEHNYETAGALAESLNDRDAIFTSARGLWHYFYDRGDLARALALAERLLALATADANAEESGLALRALGSTRMNLAEFARAQTLFDECIAASAGSPIGVCFERHGEEPQIVATQYRGLVLCLQGFADLGLETTQSALALARRSNFPLGVAFARQIVGHMLALRRDYRACLALAKEHVEFCSEYGFVFWSAGSRVLHGIARAFVDGDRNGALEAETGIVEWMKTGAGLHVPTWCSLTASAALAVSDLELAEKSLVKGLDVAGKNGDVFALAELQRLTGCLLVKQNRRDEVRETFAEAIATAREQGARLYLLRAVRDLARLLAEDGERLRAVELLQPVVDDYPEHRNGLDYREACELLAGLR
jgi:class 3 adenylate cyclase/tetratricopeptide (TPR) repeat protein